MAETETSFDLRGRHAVWADPDKVVDAALSLIEPNGSIIDIDDETNEPFVIRPRESIPTRTLPHDVWAPRLLEVARSIAGTCQRIHLIPESPTPPEEVKQELILLAYTLQSYRHDRDFIDKATSLIEIDKQGDWHPPRLPGKIRNWYYSPEIRILRGYQPPLPESHKNRSE